MKSFFQIAILVFVGALAFVTIQNHFQEYDMTVSAQEESDTDFISLVQGILEKNNNLLSKSEIYHLWAVGDIMLDRGVLGRVERNNMEYDFPFALIGDDLASADLVFGNLEGSMSDTGTDTEKAYSFRFNPAFAEALNRASFDVVSLANNHMLDWGRDSLCETTKNLESVGIDYVGAGCDTEQAEKPSIQKLGDMTIAFLAYTEFYKGAHATETRAGMSEFNMGKITTRIKGLKEEQGIDLVMVSFHAGTEYKTRSNSFQQETYKALVDAGADVVIGHHPHVAQEIERYRDGWIIYSLGNFIFDQPFSEETMRGLLADIHIQNKKIYDIQPRLIQLNSDFQPYISN